MLKSRITFLIWVLALGFTFGNPVQAVEGRVVKVLPLLVDLQGRTSVSPSLFDRDAYQSQLRKKKAECAGAIFKVQLKFKGATTTAVKVKLETRGGFIGEDRTFVAEKKIEKWGRFGNWVSIEIGKDDWERLKGVSAWRVSLWEGEKLVSEEKSFLW